MHEVYCLIRQEWVKATPEEFIRQKVVHRLINELKFPAALIALEKELSQMPHLSLQSQKIPLRRADLICFARNIHPKFDLYPLLLIECKAVKITQKALSQIVGYNHFVQAYFVGIVNQGEVKLGWVDKSQKKYTFIDYLPTHDDLVNSLQT